MAAAGIVVVLGAAAEAYAKQLAVEVGGGIVEALFNQQQIAKDLSEIKRMIAELSEFIRTKLPVLIERHVDLAFARKAEFDVAEKARTITGSIAALNEARKIHAPASSIQFMVSELAGHADSILEIGGALISYGQPYYASVGISLGAALNAYAAIVKFEPARAAALKVRAADFRDRIKPWVDEARPTSLSGVMKWLQDRYDLGAKCVPSFETWNTHTTREVAISWSEYGGRVYVAGAWFGYWKDKGLQGDTLGTFLDIPFDQAVAEGKLKYTIPEWWTVKANTPPNMEDYNRIAYELSSLIIDYFSFEENAPPAKSAIAIVTGALKQIDTILDAIKLDKIGASIFNPIVSSDKPEEVEDRAGTVLRGNQPGIGLTRKF